MEEADQLADTIFVMNHGVIIAHGSPDELKRSFMKDTAIFIRSEENFSQLTQILASKRYSFKNVDNSSILLFGMNDKLSLLMKELEPVQMEEFTMKKPNLEDVFLSLTSDNLGNSSGESHMEVVS